MTSVAPENLRLKAGGPLAPEHVYIQRPQDRQLLELLLAGEYCNLLTSRQMGKSSLMLRTADQLKQQGVAVAVVDLQKIGWPADLDRWYRGLLKEISRELGLAVDVDRWWDATQAETPNQRVLEFFRTEIAERTQAPVVIFFDEIDSTLELNYTDDFFLGLRAMYNDRSREPAYARITVCLVGAATPNELIKQQRSTPYNIGTCVELDDFDPQRDDLTPLYRAVSDSGDAQAGRSVVDAVLGVTGGHPFLTVWLCQEFLRSRKPGPEHVDRMVRDVFSSLDAVLSNANLQAHFQFILKFLGERAEDKVATLDLYRRIRRGKREPDRTAPAHVALKLSGLVKRNRDGVLVVRNPIYGQLFTAAWARKAMPAEAAQVRGFRRLAIAAAVLVLLTPAAWYELIYPRSQIAVLSTVLDDYGLAEDAYHNLHRVPFYGGKADELWAEFFERRALRDEQQQNRDRALLWRLKALSIRPDDLRRRRANALIGDDYRQLRASLRHRGEISAVAFSPRGDVVLTGSGDGTARLWSAQTGRPIGEPMKHQDRVTSVAFSPHGDMVLTGSTDGTARVWSARSGQPIGEPMRHEGPVWSLAFSPQGHLVLTGSGDGTARLWSAETGKAEGKAMKHEQSAILPPFEAEKVIPASIRSVAFSPNSEMVLTGSDDGTARLWSTRTGAPVGEAMRHGKSGEPAAVHAVAFSPQGDVVLTGSAEGWDGAARLWSVPTGRPIGEPMKHEQGVFSVAFSPRGEVVLTGSDDGTARLWDARTGRPIGEVMTHQGQIPWVRSVAFGPRGDMVLTGSWDGTARLWSARTGQPVGEPMKHTGPVMSVAFSPTGDMVLTGGGDGIQRLWSTQTGQLIGVSIKHEGSVLAVAISPQGDVVLTGSNDGMARLWSARTGQPIGEPLRHNGPVRSVAFSPRGNVVLTASLDGSARLWNAETAQPIGEPMNHDGPVWAVAFSSQGDVVLTGSNDGTARSWNAQTGQPIGEPIKQDVAVRAVALSPRGDVVLTGSRDGNSRLWSTKTGQAIGAPMSHEGEISSVAFSPDGQRTFAVTEMWLHAARIEPSGLKPIASRLLPGLAPPSGSLHFLDPAGDRIRVAVCPTGDSVRLVTMRLDAEDVPSLEGSPDALLTGWQAKLALQIDDQGTIVPLHPMFEARPRGPARTLTFGQTAAPITSEEQTNGMTGSP